MKIIEANMKRNLILNIFIALSLLVNSTTAEAESVIPRPKLILTIVLDQFRGDYLTRYESRFLPPATGKNMGGFRYLMTHGAYYPYGQYDILQCMTGPGHATILTGSYPYLNGIPSNFWYDRQLGQKVYCVEDQSLGRSPKNLNATTVGDELKNAGFPSRVVTVSIKDRAAILLGGHRADLALWLDSHSHVWTTSQYYISSGKLPKWVDELNAEVSKGLGKEVTWTPSGKSSLVADEIHGSAQFKHVYKTGTYDSYATPYGTDLTLDAAEKAIDAFHLGRGTSTDLFAVSFSSHDYVGHGYGPNSREMEEMTLSEDRAISKLLNFVNRRVSLQNVVVVLTGDHGIQSEPDWLAANGIDAGRIKDADVGNVIEAAMNEKFGKQSKPWLGLAHDFGFYFDPTVLQKAGVTIADADAVGRAAVLKIKGIAYVVTSAEAGKNASLPEMHARQSAKTYYAGRSADLTLIPKPYYTKEEDPDDHLTDYNYDRTVPIILSGLNIVPGVRAEKAEVVDIAPTLTFISGTIPPNLSEGRVLSEALRFHAEPH